MASKIFSRIARGGREIGSRLILASPRRLEPLHRLTCDLHHLADASTSSSTKLAPCSFYLQCSIFGNSSLRWFGFSSSASPHPNEEADQSSTEKGTTDRVDASENVSQDKGDEGSGTENNIGTSEDSSSKKRRRPAKRTIAFSDSDEDLSDLSTGDLVKLVAEKEELLKVKHKEIEQMQDKILRSYAEMENVIDRTKREAENSKKFAIQSFAKSLLDVADNLGRASSVVKESFSKIDSSKDSSGAVALLKTLLDGVDMTDKQLAEVFRKFGVEKLYPLNENFDPHRHNAVFQMPDASKPPGTIAVVLKAGYMLHDRILRPAEVGVTQATDNEANQNSEK